VAIAIFMCGSIGCAMAHSLSDFVIARFVQGMGGAMMSPIGRLVLLRSFDKREIVAVMTWVTMPALIGPVLGPPVGGFIVTYASWRWIFFLNVPIGILGLVLVSILIENYKEAETPPFDVAGFALTAVGLVGTMAGFEAIGRGGLPLGGALALTAIGLAALILYVRHASRHPNPILDLLLFRVPTFAIAVGGGSLFRIGIGALPFLLPLLLQLGFGMTAFASGMLTFASAVGALAMKITARPILRRWGFRKVMIANALISGGFLLSYATFRPGIPSSAILVLLLAGGFFRSLQFTSTNTLAFADVPPTRISRATSMTSTAQQLSVSMGVALGATLLHLTLLWRGTSDLTAMDFWPAFVVIALISSGSVFVYARLAPDAGAEVSGRMLIAQTPPPVPKEADD
jgi:MFS family permease